MIARRHRGRSCLMLVTLVSVLYCPAPTFAQSSVLEIIEQAAESKELDIRLTSQTSGRIDARLCDYCELLSLSIHDGTRVYLQGSLVSLETAVERAASGATVFFAPDTLLVTRIVLWARD